MVEEPCILVLYMLDLRDCDCEYVRTRCVVLDFVSLVLDDVPPVRVMIRADGGDDIVYRAEEDAGRW